MRNILIAANWKLNPSSRLESINLVEGIKTNLKKLGSLHQRQEIVLCVPSIYLGLVQSIMLGTELRLGAQNCYFEEKGAFTGELSPLMLAEFGVKYVILGHSERRTLFGETSQMVSKKAQITVKNGLTPIICVGESLEQRNQNLADRMVLEQIEASLRGVKVNTKNLVIAYEPIWAIGTGETCSDQEANRICGLIRHKIEELYDTQVAEQILILYGGSVKATTIANQMKQSEIDGALIGSASLKAEEFTSIIGQSAFNPLEERIHAES